MPLVGTNPLFKITEFQTYIGQPCINTFWYRTANANVVVASAISAAFQTAVSVARRAISNTFWSSDSLEVEQVNSLSNFGEFTSYGAGTYTTGSTEAVAQFIAAPLRLLRTTKETRSGWKRLAGLSEGQLAGETLTVAMLALMQTYADLLEAPLSAGGETHFPVIVRIVKTGVPPEPVDPTLWIYNPVSAVVPVDRVTTQNSRKFYS